MIQVGHVHNPLARRIQLAGQIDRFKDPRRLFLGNNDAHHFLLLVDRYADQAHPVPDTGAAGVADRRTLRA